MGLCPSLEQEGTPLSERNEKWYQLDRRSLSNLIVVCVGILLYLVLTHLDRVRTAADAFMTVLTPFITGFVIAYLLNTPTNYFERKVFDKFKNPRLPAIVMVYCIALLVILVMIELLLPQIGDSIASLIGNLSFYLENLNQMVQELIAYLGLETESLTGLVDDYQTIVNRAVEFVSSSVPNLLNFGVAVGNGVINSLTALIASIYMLAGKDRLIRQMKKLIYALFPAKGSSQILSVASKANQIFVGFINGKIIDSAIIGVLCFILTSILSIPYAVLVSVVVGVTNIIPFFGPIIGAIPCLMILLMVDPWASLRFGILIIVLQQFDGNILGPKILGNSTGLSALWVLAAIVVGGGLFGFAGMLLGVPTFAVLYTLVREWADKKLAQKGIDANGQPVGMTEAAEGEPPLPDTIE